jgi:hypothetical protein
VAGDFLFFNYDGDHQLMVTVFDETMCLMRADNHPVGNPKRKV